MSKAQDILYGIVAVLIFILAPALVESHMLAAIIMVAVAAILERIAERIRPNHYRKEENHVRDKK